MYLFSSGPRLSKSCRLQRNVAALRVSTDPKSFGFLVELPVGVHVEVCGVGYNDRTVEVRLDDESYIVFAQDIEPDSIGN